MTGEFGEVFHEGGDEGPGPGSGACGEQVERSVLLKERAGVELFARRWVDGVEDGWVGEHASAWLTAIQIDSRVRGSELIIPSRGVDHAGAAVG